jgi:hypothetical protein
VQNLSLSERGSINSLSLWERARVRAKVRMRETKIYNPH